MFVKERLIAARVQTSRAVSAGNLQRAGLVSYMRGEITILNRRGLENAACECYAVVRGEFDRPLPA